MEHIPKQQKVQRYRSFSFMALGNMAMEVKAIKMDMAMEATVKYWGARSTIRCSCSGKGVGCISQKMDDDANSFSEYEPLEQSISINMDVDDIVIRDIDETSQVDTTELRPSAITLNHLLQRTSCSTGNWTHLVKQPDVYRCSVTDIQAAGELYRAVWRYADAGLGVMERRLSPITRLSLEVCLGSHQLVATRQAEQDLIRCILDAVLVDLRDIVTLNRLPPQALVCFVLRGPRSSGCSQRYWFHWPALAVSNREMTRDWCLRQWARPLEQQCEAIVPRNTSSYVPMYGCIVSIDDQPMLVHWVVDSNAKVHEQYIEWLLHSADAAALSDVFHIGYDRRWPTQRDLDEARVRRLMPLLMSINPMGTPCVVFTPPRSVSATLDENARRLRGMVHRIMENLGDHRRMSYTRSNEVGQYIYQLASGADWAMQEWVQWVCHGANSSTQQSAELVFQWHTFAQGDADVDAQSVLQEMVQQDNPPEVVTRFLYQQRLADHEGRGVPDGMLFSVIGSATHHDLAQYIKHELQSVVVCTSMAGHGLWYTYKRDTHRWMLDPEGSDVLMQCLHILLALVSKLRQSVNDTTTDNAAGDRPRAGRSPFPVLANFPLEGHSDRDIEKAVLVHLDTIVGDVRHMQSVVRYLARGLFYGES